VIDVLVPEWEETGATPVVFVRVANKGVRAYVKWKSVEVIENNRAQNGKVKMENGRREGRGVIDKRGTPSVAMERVRK